MLPHSSFKNIPPEIAEAPKIVPSTSSKMCAPTELLAQFVSTLMRKDFENALILCKLIQQFEPSNATVKRFHPMIVKKLQMKGDSESESSDEEQEDEEEVAGDSGIDEKKVDDEKSANEEENSSSSSESSDDEEAVPEALDPKSLAIEAQREIIERLRSQVVPARKWNLTIFRV